MFTLFNLINGLRPTISYDTEFESKLKGNRLLFIHTGGQLGLFDNFKFDILFK